MTRVPGAPLTWLLSAGMRLPLPRRDVFPFFADAHNLERITPALLRFEVLTPAPITMATGTLIDYRLRIRGVPVRWRTRISAWNEPESFTDSQLRGPYREWTHEHTFIDEGPTTYMFDRVRYRVPGGPLAPVINRFFVERDVIFIFTERARILREIFGVADGRRTEPQGTGVTVPA